MTKSGVWQLFSIYYACFCQYIFDFPVLNLPWSLVILFYCFLYFSVCLISGFTDILLFEVIAVSEFVILIKVRPHNCHFIKCCFQSLKAQFFQSRLISWPKLPISPQLHVCKNFAKKYNWRVLVRLNKKKPI